MATWSQQSAAQEALRRTQAKRGTLQEPEYNTGTPEYRTDPNAGQPKWGNDPRGAAMNEIAYQNRRFEDRIDPTADFYERELGRAAESDYGYQTDIQNALRDIYSGGGSSVGGSSRSVSRRSGGGSSGGGGGGGGGGSSSFDFGWDPITQERISYTDPFNSYAGFQDFSVTGGFSEADIANLRARGVSPVRAAYANAEREVSRQRGLQGGYAPNAVAAQVRMAREQGQANADAVQSVEALIADQRQKGRLAGLTGMSGIETSRLGADIDVGKFNAQGAFDVATYNADQRARAQAASASARNAANSIRQRAAAASSAARSAANQTSAYSRAASNSLRLQAIELASQDRSKPGGASEMWSGRQNDLIEIEGSHGLGSARNVIEAGRNPGEWEQTSNRVNDVFDIYNRGSGAASAARPYRPYRAPTTPGTGYGATVVR